MKYEELKDLTIEETLAIHNRVHRAYIDKNKAKLNTFKRVFKNYRCPVCDAGGVQLKIINERHIYCHRCEHEYTSLDNRDSDFEFLGDGVIK